MSDVMLHAVLCMPPEIWSDSEIDRRQRYSRYLAASQRILDDERKIELLQAELAEQHRLHALGVEGEARLMARVEKLQKLNDDAEAVIIRQRDERKRLGEEIAASQAREAVRVKAIAWTLEFLQRDQWMDYRSRSIVSDTLAGSVEVVLNKALALPQDRSALDAQAEDVALWIKGRVPMDKESIDSIIDAMGEK